MTWRRIDIKMSFTAPAFLGSADKSAQLRVPPFKYLIRFWWRVAVAKRHDYEHAKIRKLEGSVFGNAWLKDEHGNVRATRSRVLIRLDHWKKGEGDNNAWNRTWFDQNKVLHPEAGKGNKGRWISPDVYLAYGPIVWDKEQKLFRLADGVTFINPGTQFTLTLINDPLDPVTEDEFPFMKVLKLIHWFGSVGSRSANGWGSLVIEGIEVEGDLNDTGSWNLKPDNLRDMEVSREIMEILKAQTQWPHAVGMNNEEILVWQSKVYDTLEELIKILAELKISFRTQFQLSKDSKLEERHVLAYPVTHHNVLGAQARLKNQVFFKIRKVGEKFQAIIVHLPHAFPTALSGGTSTNTKDLLTPQKQKEIWEDVHKMIDSNGSFRRIR